MNGLILLSRIFIIILISTIYSSYNYTNLHSHSLADFTLKDKADLITPLHLDLSCCYKLEYIEDYGEQTFYTRKESNIKTQTSYMLFLPKGRLVRFSTPICDVNKKEYNIKEEDLTSDHISKGYGYYNQHAKEIHLENLIMVNGVQKVYRYAAIFVNPSTLRVYDYNNLKQFGIYKKKTSAISLRDLIVTDW